MEDSGVLIAFRHNKKEIKDLSYLTPEHDFTTAPIHPGLIDRAVTMYSDKKKKWDLNLDGISIVYFDRLYFSALATGMSTTSINMPYTVVMFSKVEHGNDLVEIEFRDRDTNELIAMADGELVLSTVFYMGYEEQKAEAPAKPKEKPKAKEKPSADAILGAL